MSMQTLLDDAGKRIKDHFDIVMPSSKYHGRVPQFEMVFGMNVKFAIIKIEGREQVEIRLYIDYDNMHTIAVSIEALPHLFHRVVDQLIWCAKQTASKPIPQIDPLTWDFTDPLPFSTVRNKHVYANP